MRRTLNRPTHSWAWTGLALLTLAAFLWPLAHAVLHHEDSPDCAVCVLAHRGPIATPVALPTAAPPVEAARVGPVLTVHPVARLQTPLPDTRAPPLAPPA